MAGSCGIRLFCVGSLQAGDLLVVPSGRVHSFVFIVSLSPRDMVLGSRSFTIKIGIRIIGKSLYNIRNRLIDVTGHARIVVQVGNVLATDVGIPGDCLRVLSWVVMVTCC